MSSRRLRRSILGILLFALASVCAGAQQTVPVSRALQELRDIGTKDPLRILQTAPAIFSSPDDLVKLKNTPVIVVQGDEIAP